MYLILLGLFSFFIYWTLFRMPLRYQALLMQQCRNIARRFLPDTLLVTRHTNQATQVILPIPLLPSRPLSPTSPSSSHHTDRLVLPGTSISAPDITSHHASGRISRGVNTVHLLVCMSLFHPPLESLRLISTRCGHIYCTDCFSQMMLYSGFRCLRCSARVHQCTPGGYHRIYCTFHEDPQAGSIQ